jgi:hypothetical protein
MPAAAPAAQDAELPNAGLIEVLQMLVGAAPAYSLIAPFRSDNWRDEAVRYMRVAADRIAALSEQAAELTRESDQWRTWGTIEVAIRNPSVSESMRHWEGRAESAEARCAAMERALVELVAIKDSVDTVISCRVAATTTEGYALLDRVIAEHKQRYPLGEQEAFKAAWDAARLAAKGAA